MKFKKEIKIIVEGELFDQDTNLIELIKNINFSWKHWWESDPGWIYGIPTEKSQKIRIEKISIAPQTQ